MLIFFYPQISQIFTDKLFKIYHLRNLWMVFTSGASHDFGKCALLVRAGGMKYNIIPRSPPEANAKMQRMFGMCDKRFDI
jgi:hypothetical protein